MSTKGREVAPPTGDDIAKRIEEVDASIRTKAAARAALVDDLDEAIVRAPIGDLDIARKRRSLAELDTTLANLQSDLAALRQHFRAARQREADTRWAEAHARSRTRAEELKSAASKLQAALDATVPLALALREADARFVESLRRPPPDFDKRLISVALPQVMSLRLYMLSDGVIRAEHAYENPHELRMSGAADIVKRAGDYCTVGLRGAAIPPMSEDFDPDPPPLAA